jgi:hypothetical protein
LVAFRGYVVNGSATRVTEKRIVTVPDGTRTVGLPLTDAGRRSIADCTEGRQLKATGTYGRRHKVVETTAGLVIDRPACDEPAGGTSPGPDLSGANPDRCDFLDQAVCLQPWPNDYFTTSDSSTPTGKRLNLDPDSTPANTHGTHIDPTDANRADGFSPGNLIVTKVPGLDNKQAFENTGAVPITDMARYADPNQPVVVINAATGKRQPVFAELDANPADASDVNLIIRPAVNWDEGARYVVALRNLKDSAGTTIEPSEAFKVYRDRLITPQPVIEQRRPHMEDLFDTLQGAGIKRKNLYLAWDFTVASEHSLTSRALHIRDDAFAGLGDTNLSDMQVQGSSPQFTITHVTNFAPCGDDGCQGPELAEDPTGLICTLLDAVGTVTDLTGLGTLIGCGDLPGATPSESDKVARQVQGQITVPCYLFPTCQPGGAFNLDGSGNPTANPLPYTAGFTCNIPRSADAAHPATVSLYGHGLLGAAGEVNAGNVQTMGQDHDFMFCATDWAGFSTRDIPTVLLNLQDLSNFNRFIDRMQQGFLNFMFMGRAMIHPDGFAADAAFQDANGNPLIDNERLFYDGNSQGGIMGGALTSLEPDLNRAVLGVPGMNYSTLLQRSSDFAPYARGEFQGAICDEVPAEVKDVCESTVPADTPLGLYDNYDNELERPLIFSLMQLLWDRGEANGYAHHMTSDPLPNTPSHDVLLDVAFGDHQVANIAAEVEARTIGARYRAPGLDPGRGTIDDFFGLNPITSFPYSGSALVMWDGGPKDYPGGADPAPITDIPPGPEQGADPHSYPRGTAEAQAQKAAFLAIGGALIDTCGAHPCYSHGYPGP